MRSTFHFKLYLHCTYLQSLLGRVALHVKSHVRLSVEAFPADLTAVWFLSGVCAAVLLQSGVVTETPAAGVTQVGLLTCVCPDVPHHVVSAVEGFPALAAEERLLPRVDPHVHLQVSLAVETLPAHFANFPVFVSFQVKFEVFLGVEMRPANAAQVCGVTFGVIHQRNHGVEHFPAHFTYGPSLLLLWRRRLHLLLAVAVVVVFRSIVRLNVLLVHVNQQVPLQRGVVIEAFPAHGARVGLFPCVYPDVSHHVVSTVEGLAALAAVKRLLSGVDPHVRLQRAGGSETFPADAADFSLHVCFQVNMKALLRVETFPAHAADVLGVNLHVIHQRDVGVKGFPADFAADSRFSFFVRVQCRSRRQSRALPLLPRAVAVAVVAL